ncbi:MAG TPA: response regulator, partial [Thermodesulfobacteriota bacterium]|nr:response regulator [Thermodesulfobacteriota bacterium]
IADDDVTMRLLACEALEQTGFQVMEAQDGEEALEAFHHYQPQVVLLDVMMPKMDGFAVCETLRLIPGGQTVPIFMITGCDDMESITKAYESGATDFITKPVNWLILGRRVHAMLRAYETLNALRKSELKHRALLDAIPDLIVQINVEGSIIDCKTAPEFQELFLADHSASTHITQAMPSSFSTQIMTNVEKALRTGEIQGFEYIFPSNGSYRAFDSRIVASGENEATAIIQEVTRRKQAEEDLQASMHQLRETMQGIIQVISSTVECKDPYTAGHQRRVSNLAQAIATLMNLPENQVDAIRIAAAIHDLGKISIPAEILSKPGRLSTIEFQIIKTHPQVGYEILRPIDFPWPIAHIVYQHHERMDGSGYPLGLRGNAILIEARIIAVADVLEAMASHRPYRPTLGINQALEEISRNRGITYDEDVVDACLTLIQNKGFTFDQHE